MYQLFWWNWCTATQSLVILQYVLRKKSLAPWMIAKFRQFWHSAVKWKELFLIYFFSIPVTFFAGSTRLQILGVFLLLCQRFCFRFVQLRKSLLWSNSKNEKGSFFMEKNFLPKIFTLHSFKTEGDSNSYQSLFVRQVWRRSPTSKWIYCIVDPSTTTRKWRGTVPHFLVHKVLNHFILMLPIW